MNAHYCDVIMGAMASQITSPAIVYLSVYSGADQHQSSASPAFVREIHRWPVNSPHKWPVTRKMFPFDGVIMNWRDIACCIFSNCEQNIAAYKCLARVSTGHELNHHCIYRYPSISRRHAISKNSAVVKIEGVCLTQWSLATNIRASELDLRSVCCLIGVEPLLKSRPIYRQIDP